MLKNYAVVFMMAFLGLVLLERQGLAQIDRKFTKVQVNFELGVPGGVYVRNPILYRLAVTFNWWDPNGVEHKTMVRTDPRNYVEVSVAGVYAIELSGWYGKPMIAIDDRRHDRYAKIIIDLDKVEILPAQIPGEIPIKFTIEYEDSSKPPVQGGGVIRTGIGSDETLILTFVCRAS